jgi:hypothetical protein
MRASEPPMKLRRSLVELFHMAFFISFLLQG